MATSNGKRPASVTPEKTRKHGPRKHANTGANFQTWRSVTVLRRTTKRTHRRGGSAASIALNTDSMETTTSNTAAPSVEVPRPCSALPSRIVQIVSMGFCAGPNNGDCYKLIALCEDGSLWEQWHSMGYANVPTDGLWYPIHEPNSDYTTPVCISKYT